MSEEPGDGGAGAEAIDLRLVSASVSRVVRSSTWSWCATAPTPRTTQLHQTSDVT